MRQSRVELTGLSGGDASQVARGLRGDGAKNAFQGQKRFGAQQVDEFVSGEVQRKPVDKEAVGDILDEPAVLLTK